MSYDYLSALSNFPKQLGKYLHVKNVYEDFILLVKNYSLHT